MEQELKKEQFIPRPLDETFSFFKEAKNLELITPPYLHFHVLSQSTPSIQEGTCINYLLFLRGFPMWWQSKIIEWEENKQFIDVQCKGPYKKWEHRHIFKEVNGGTLVRDEISFEVYLERFFLSFIKKDVEKIFAYRMKKLKEIFEI